MVQPQVVPLINPWAQTLLHVKHVITTVCDAHVIMVTTAVGQRCRRSSWTQTSDGSCDLTNAKSTCLKTHGKFGHLVNGTRTQPACSTAQSSQVGQECRNVRTSCARIASMRAGSNKLVISTRSALTITKGWISTRV